MVVIKWVLTCGGGWCGRAGVGGGMLRHISIKSV